MESPKKFLKRAPRHPVNMDAWVRAKKGAFGKLPCRVLDVSRNGVRLEAADTNSIPDNFILLFSKDDAGHSATVKWRRGTQIGAEFSKA